MKILVLMNRVPYPVNDGWSIAVSSMSKGLKDAGHSLHLACFNTRKHFVAPVTLQETLAEVYDSVQYTYLDASVKPWPAFKNLFSGRSYSIERFCQKEFETALIELLEKESFDLVLVEGLFMAPYLQCIRKYGKNVKVLLRTHNVEYQIWQRLADSCNNWFKKAYLILTWKRLKNYEVSVLDQFDALLPITEEDAQILRSLGATRPMHVSVPGIPIPKMKQTEPAIDLVYLGALNWQPNQQGVIWFMEKVWPMLLQQRAATTCRIAGKQMPSWMKRWEQANAVLCGEVSDAKEFIRSGKIFVIPLLAGSGVRLKLMEAMALGCCIVTTTIGAEGVHAEHEREFLIADTPEEFTAAILRCLQDPELAGKLGKNAHLYAQKNFDNAILTKNLLDFCDSL